MPRQRRDALLDSRERRLKLPVQKEPHWRPLQRGLTLGYTRNRRSAGSWIVRRFANGRYVHERIGVADDYDEADGVVVLSWSDAVKRSIGLEARLAANPNAARITVRQVIDEYLRTREARSRSGYSLRVDRISLHAHVLPKLGNRRLIELTTHDLQRWLDGLIRHTDDREKKRRSQATANRIWNVFRAALNHAFRAGLVDSDTAWRRVRPFPNVDRPGERALSILEARRVIENAEHAFGVFARVILLTGLRPDEAANLTVGDFDGMRVAVAPRKTGKGRSIPLNAEGRTLLSRIVQGRSGREPLLLREDGERWTPRTWQKGMRRAVTAAEIEPATVRDLRRSFGTLLINAGARAESVQRLLGHGDQRMTLRTYARLLDEAQRADMEKLPTIAESTHMEQLPDPLTRTRTGPVPSV